MKKIQLTQGQVALVDDWNYEWLNRYSWCACWCPTTQSYYTVAWIPEKRERVQMHCLIVEKRKGLKKGQLCDHADRQTLNNQEHNLRACNVSQNRQNRTIQTNNRSGYKGVSWSKFNGKWKVQITLNNRTTRLGYYDDKIIAAAAYDAAAIRLFGEFAVLNFAREGYRAVEDIDKVRAAEKRTREIRSTTCQTPLPRYPRYKYPRYKSYRSMSNYKGIYWYKARDKWMVRITVNKKVIFLGYYEDELEAAAAYDVAAMDYHGKLALLNFPQEGYRSINDPQPEDF